jgi:hypothetical protein
VWPRRRPLPPVFPANRMRINAVTSACQIAMEESLHLLHHSLASSGQTHCHAGIMTPRPAQLLILVPSACKAHFLIHRVYRMYATAGIRGKRSSPFEPFGISQKMRSCVSAMALFSRPGMHVGVSCERNSNLNVTAPLAPSHQKTCSEAINGERVWSVYITKFRNALIDLALVSLKCADLSNLCMIFEPTWLLKVKLALRLLQEEGLFVYRDSFAYDAFQFCVAASDLPNAKSWITKAREERLAISGPNTETARQYEVYWQNPKAHLAWGIKPTMRLRGPDR